MLASAEKYGDKPALMQRDGKRFVTLTYRELLARARAVGSALLAAGIHRGDRIALMSENRPEWAILDWGAQLAGVIVVPLFPTLSASQVGYILKDSGAKLLFCEDAGIVARCEPAIEALNPTPKLVSLEPDPRAEHFPDFLQLGAGHPFQPADTQPDDLCTLIYTSGTTGDPKGVMLTHRNLLSNIESCLEALDVGPEDVFLWTLPLSHVFSRMAAHFLPVYCGATIVCGKSLRTLADDMRLGRPTVMLMVPRFLDQLKARIEDNGAGLPRIQKALFRWALSVGLRLPPKGSRLERVPVSLRWRYALADRLVGRKVRARFGGRLRFAVSGAAALPIDVSAFFNAFGIVILQGYGLTETSPVISVNRPDANRFGTVGPPIPGVEVRIAEDGEILTRGPHVMKGYYGLPEATREVLSPDGWFATGDVGEIDSLGYLRITDRKKDLLVLANGKNVAPQPIEALLKSSPLIEEAVVLGDGQPVVTALIVPDFDALRQAIGTSETNPAQIVSLPESLKRIRDEVDTLCQAVADYERVRRFALLPERFTVEGGELTPTLKVRRPVIRQKYASIIQSLSGDRD